MAEKSEDSEPTKSNSFRWGAQRRSDASYHIMNRVADKDHRKSQDSAEHTRRSTIRDKLIGSLQWCTRHRLLLRRAGCEA